MGSTWGGDNGSSMDTTVKHWVDELKWTRKAQDEPHGGHHIEVITPEKTDKIILETHLTKVSSQRLLAY